MPEVFFRESVRRPVTRSRARWTVMGSFLLHGVLVLTILIAPVLGSLALPPFTRPTFIVFADARPVPPAPAPPPPAIVRVPPAVVPLSAPEGFHEEKPAQAGPPARGVPGGFDLPSTSFADVPSAGRGTPPETFTPPKPPGPVRPGGNILPPSRTSYVAPVYPPVAITARREGTVVLEALIDETGTVRDVTVLRSVPLLDRAAIEAVRQWRYSPTRLNGVPVAILMTVNVTFTLK